MEVLVFQRAHYYLQRNSSKKGIKEGGGWIKRKKKK